MQTPYVGFGFTLVHRLPARGACRSLERRARLVERREHDALRAISVRLSHGFVAHRARAVGVARARGAVGRERCASAAERSSARAAKPRRARTDPGLALFARDRERLARERLRVAVE